MTSAPKSPSSMAQYGPASASVSSMTRMESRMLVTPKIIADNRLRPCRNLLRCRAAILPPRSTALTVHPAFPYREARRLRPAGRNLERFARMVRQTLCFLLALVSCAAAHAQAKRKVIVDEDCSGPGGTNMQAVLTLVNSPDTEVLGITVPTGDAWRDEEVAHALRLLEIIGRPDIPVVLGAVFPLVNSKEFVSEWEAQYGKVPYQGAWNTGNPMHGPWEIPPLPEGA